MQRNIARSALLVGTSLVLFLVEGALPAPLPVPGAKLGLANAVTIWTVYTCDLSEALLILVCRIMLGALLTGNPFSLAFSLAGGLSSLLLCVYLKRMLTNLPMWQCSVVGGLMHNIAQLGIAISITKSIALIHYAPYLIIAGIACGAATGSISQMLSARLNAIRKYTSKKGGEI